MGQIGIPPLRWPEWYLNASQTQRFLADVPFVGLYARVRRYVWKELAKRSYRSIEQWGGSIRRHRCVCVVSPIVMEHLRWPNSFFVPNDLCELLFWDPGPDLLSVEALCCIEKSLELPAGVAELRDGMTYGEFIDGIVCQVAHSVEQTGSPNGGGAML